MVVGWIWYVFNEIKKKFKVKVIDIFFFKFFVKKICLCDMVYFLIDINNFDLFVFLDICIIWLCRLEFKYLFYFDGIVCCYDVRVNIFIKYFFVVLYFLYYDRKVENVSW